MKLRVVKKQLEDLVRMMGYIEDTLEAAGDEHNPVFFDYATELSIIKERVKEMAEDIE